MTRPIPPGLDDALNRACGIVAICAAHAGEQGDRHLESALLVALDMLTAWIEPADGKEAAK